MKSKAINYITFPLYNLLTRAESPGPACYCQIYFHNILAGAAKVELTLRYNI
ncbi:MULTISPECIES: hypothetical protein [Leptospira]|uniref:hypothetical protein n=1 Tax=Leptospira TaxID=171 RepID=UPI000B2422C7|nr:MULTISPECIES: hypothetical protein [Leptospira]